LKIGVTGGAGFIGSHVVDALVADGHEVAILDMATPRWAPAGATHRPVDLMNQQDLIDATAGLDVIFHLAAYADVNEVVREPISAVDLNVGGTMRVLEAAKTNGLKRVVLASTVWVYSSYKPSEENETVGEDVLMSIDANRHVYTSTKIAAEMLCQDYWNMHGLPFTILRYGIPYGPRMRPSLVLPIFVRKALAGEPLTVTGDGLQHRKFIYVEDLARGHVLALSEAGKNQTFNLDGTEKVTILEIAQTALRLTGSTQEVQFGPARPGDYGGVEVSSEHAKAVLGWEPKMGWAEGAAKTVQWLMDQAAATTAAR
jgi:UDP-glucose 4-epimerase